MRTKIIIPFLTLVMVPIFTLSAAEHLRKSKYTGQEKREIKSLSESDIEELKNGRGWGLAKPAELNGMPGPAHLLEMRGEIDLSMKQVQAIEDLFTKMEKEAIPLGHQLIELERELNNHFANRTITSELLSLLLERIAQVKKELRYVHLSTHLKTPSILRPEQISLYKKLRGYSSDDLCKNIPEGHDPEMWETHHNC
jgi:Spy/CpxP family protein refolding chaperone